MLTGRDLEEKKQNDEIRGEEITKQTNGESSKIQ